MAILTDRKSLREYDVIIVGSGAGGGMMGMLLALNGVKVLMIEAGRNYDPQKETPMFNTPDKAPLRGKGTQDRFFGHYDATVGGGWQVPGEPYGDKPGTEEEFWWWRPRMLGGRTNHWGRISLRFGEYDFKPKSRDGLGFDWPISYTDLAPYYDKAELMVGIYGSTEGLENTPDSPPGILQPAPKPRAAELLIKKYSKGLNIPVVPIHRAVLSEPMDGPARAAKLFPNNPSAQRIVGNDMSMRAACFWATTCGRGCSIRANFQSTTVLIPPALQTGNLDIITDAMVREVMMDANGKATGVHYVDKITRTDAIAKARIVILSASTCETARILLNSKSALFPNGLANGSGQVGKNLTDSVGSSMGGHVPELESLPPYNEDGAGGGHVYTPWWNYKTQEKLGFARGYHIEMGGGRYMPGMGSLAILDQKAPGVYGKKLKEEAKRYYGAVVGFAGRGEMIPNENCYCEIDPNRVDQWGIPTLRFHWKWSDHEINQATHMQNTFAEIINSMGGKATPKPGKEALNKPGEIIHEAGTAMMGSDAKSSVVNSFGQTWDVKNLFLMDASILPSNPDKNLTLTVLALAWRSADYLLDEMKQGNI
ncbi:GMC family oxidoreductase [Luteolibacter sp. GHJ8]|uniref:GMC family oxidoreductase n=1 Tax=Luteolibacter rhizosphaerae TaxID=2989719 RepID=A0ABT3G4X9_9BACT|nr:GMC family oxidoreductase [Luteolibacter rhizosphaerae]MCW1914916.1 GMC family oxidoreductase [Luteolibacter rhizosphaerae]